MDKLNLPPFAIHLEKQDGKIYVWDKLRQKWVRLTPEEWVRQHFVHYLIEELGYPQMLLMNEVSISVETLSRRVDTVLYDRMLTPLLICEYKSPKVTLSERSLHQILNYNYALRVPYLILSNGMEHRAYHIDYETMSYTPLDTIPEYTTLEQTNH